MQQLHLYYTISFFKTVCVSSSNINDILHFSKQTTTPTGDNGVHAVSPVEKDTDTASGNVYPSTHANQVTTENLMGGTHIAKDPTTRKNSATTKSAVQIVSFRSSIPMYTYRHHLCMVQFFTLFRLISK